MIVEDFKKVTPDLTTHTDLSVPIPSIKQTILLGYHNTLTLGCEGIMWITIVYQ